MRFECADLLRLMSVRRNHVACRTTSAGGSECPQYFEAQVEPRRRRLRLSQTRPVFSRLGLGGKQRSQLTLLLGDKHPDHLSAYLWHVHPTHIGNTFEPEQH